jgi:hypothetical protein
MPTEQIMLPFASLDFPADRTSIALWEMAAKLGCSTDHLLNEAEAGAIAGVDLRGANASRRNIRVPIEAYRAYVIERMTGPFRREFLRELPRAVLRQLLLDVDRTTLAELLAEIGLAPLSGGAPAMKSPQAAPASRG